MISRSIERLFCEGSGGGAGNATSERIGEVTGSKCMGAESSVSPWVEGETAAVEPVAARRASMQG